MKKIILFILLFCLIPFYTDARNLNDVNVKMTSDINQYCPSKNALSCIYYGNSTIYIRNDLNHETLKLVLTHELGHFLMQDITYDMYQDVFGEGPLYELEEKAANAFYSFVWLPKNIRVLLMPKIQIEFFKYVLFNID